MNGDHQKGSPSEPQPLADASGTEQPRSSGASAISADTDAKTDADVAATPNWTTLNSRVVYENDWIEVSHRDVVAPTGHTGIYGLVHFKNRAVGIVPLDTEGCTWLVGQWRYTLNAWSWEIPEGGAPTGESTLDAARRELTEETGLVAARWSSLLTLHTSNSVTDESAVIYLAQELTQQATCPDETERLVLKRLPLSEAVEMALDGRITDSLSMAALLKMHALQVRNELPS